LIDLVKQWFEKRSSELDFKVGDLVLKWEERAAKLGHHSKFDSLWSGPYKIMVCKQNSDFDLINEAGELLEIPINGIYLKHHN